MERGLLLYPLSRG